MNKKKLFLKILNLAEKKYSSVEKRLASDDWPHPWQTLIATIMSAQSRDETTIPIAENLFKKYPSVEKIAKANYSVVLSNLKSLNYNRTKAKNIIACAQMLIKDFNSIVPNKIDELIKLPGVGRKTANLVLSEVHAKDSIC